MILSSRARYCLGIHNSAIGRNRSCPINVPAGPHTIRDAPLSRNELHFSQFSTVLSTSVEGFRSPPRSFERTLQHRGVHTGAAAATTVENGSLAEPSCGNNAASSRGVPERLPPNQIETRIGRTRELTSGHILETDGHSQGRITQEQDPYESTPSLAEGLCANNEPAGLIHKVTHRIYSVFHTVHRFRRNPWPQMSKPLSRANANASWSTAPARNWDSLRPLKSDPIRTPAGQPDRRRSARRSR